MNNKIKDYRLKNKLTQQQLADLMSVTRQAVTRWESGAVEPSTENLISLSKIFNCSVDEILSNEHVVPKGKIIIKEVIIKEKKKAPYWNIQKANKFLYIISSIALAIYLFILRPKWYSLTVIAVTLFPIIIISTIIALICNNDKIIDKANFKKLMYPPLLIILGFMLLGIIIEL